MKIINLGLAVFCLLSASTTSSKATTITFNDGSSLAPVGSTYLSLGFQSSNLRFAHPPDVIAFPFVEGWGADIDYGVGLIYGDFNFSNQISGISSFSVDVWRQKTPDERLITISAFDKNGNEITSNSWIVPAYSAADAVPLCNLVSAESCFAPSTYSISTPNIASVQFLTDVKIGFDTLRFDGSEIPPVPVPAALPLFATGLGVLGLLGWRRKRKNAAA